MTIYIEKAREIVARHVKHGIPKEDAKALGLISAIGTERNYRNCLAHYLEWCDDNGIPTDHQGDKKKLLAYLHEISEIVKQKTLDQEHDALSLIYKLKLKHIKSLRDTVLVSRSYNWVELNKIIKFQTLGNNICTLLAFFSGLRAHEMATIMPIEHRSHSYRPRKWDPRRFTGIPKEHSKRYTVEGKGGLIREVVLPLWLSDLLETRRRVTPLRIRDREIFYDSYYDISYGQKWSQSFSRASKKALGFSNGGHGLRHSYAKWRLMVLIKYFSSEYPKLNKRNIRDLAYLILSQELGHFRPTLIPVYTR